MNLSKLLEELQSPKLAIYRGLTLRVAGFARLLLFFGDSMSAGAVFRDAARVDLAAGAAGLAATVCFVAVVAARTRFLGTERSTETFSLSSLAASSLLRFLLRVEAVGTDLDDACLVTGLAAGFGAALAAAGRDVVVVGAVRVFGAGAGAEAGAETGAGAGAGAFFVGAFLGAALAGAGSGFAGGGGEGARSSTRGIWRFVAGTRFTRLSRRDRRLAH